MNCTAGEWKIRKTVDNSGDHPFPTYDIIAVFDYGPQGIGTAYQNPFNARLFAMSKDMLEILIKLYESAEKEDYENTVLGQKENIKKIIDLATGGQ